MSRGRKLWMGLVVACGVLVGLEGLLRVVARKVGYATIPDEQVRQHVAQGSMKYDAELGWTWAQVPQTGLGINSHAFRYAEISPEKEPGMWRAFTFGDSQTYGAGVAADQSYTAFAERSLVQKGSNKKIQMINAGISGYGSLQVLRLIRSKVLAWKPDLLIVDCRTYDSPHDSLVPAASGWLKGVDGLLFQSRTWYLMRFGIEKIRSQARPMRAAGMQMSKEELAAGFGNHEAIADLARREKIDLIFLDYPFSDAKGITCLAPAAELPEGVVVAPVCEVLQKSGLGTAELFLDNNHLTVEGNRRVGERLAATILEAGLVR